MPEEPDLNDPSRSRTRILSGPRGPRASQSSFRSTSGNVLAISTPKKAAPLRGKSSTYSLTSLAKLRELNDSPLDTLIDAEQDYTLSPDQSPELKPSDPLADSSLDKRSGTFNSFSLGKQKEVKVSPVKSPAPRQTSFQAPTGKRAESPPRSQTLSQRPVTPPSSFMVNRLSSSTATSGMTSPPVSTKTRPKVSKLNTLNLLNPHTPPTKPVSPGMRHWQQVRSHVMAPTPVEERQSTMKQGKKLNLVSKAAGKFGFRHAAENVMGYNGRRGSTFTFSQDVNGLSAEEREEITRERRKFARDVKNCLDACAQEETSRRLQRSTSQAHELRFTSTAIHRQTEASASSHLTTQRFKFDPNFSSFAPLLTELHRHLPSARAKRLWSRTCPHHAAILSELAVNFLPDTASTDGERQQALEVFGVIVRNWASDSAEEELDRWLFLCKVLLLPDKQLRNRALPLLASFLHADPDMSTPHDRPHTAASFQTLAMALFRVVHEMTRQNAYEEHLQVMWSFLSELAEGDIIEMDYTSLREILVDQDENLRDATAGVERDLLWLALARLSGTDKDVAVWMIDNGGHVLTQFAPPALLHAIPPTILRLRLLSTTILLASLTSLTDSAVPSLCQNVWRAAGSVLIDVNQLPDTESSLANSLGVFLFKLELELHKERSFASSSEAKDPFKITTIPESDRDTDHRLQILTLGAQERWKAGFDDALRQLVLVEDVSSVCRMLRFFLQSAPFLPSGRQGVSYFLQRLSIGSRCIGPEFGIEAQTFLQYLQQSHPQLLYKSLFSLSASITPVNVQTHLQAVRATASILGNVVYWTRADPQMVVIILLGDVTPKQSKGKGREGEQEIVEIKLGRYACMIELLLALDGIEPGKGKSKSMKNFVDTIETRLSIMLDVEEKERCLPPWYRSLVCRLFLKCRSISLSMKQPQWQRIIFRWLGDSSAISQEAALAQLRPIYSGLRVKDPSCMSQPVNSRSLSSIRKDVPLSTWVKEDELFDLRLDDTLTSLLVATHSTLTRDNWSFVLSEMWSSFGQSSEKLRPLAFLLMKCGEHVPGEWQVLVLSQLQSKDVIERTRALRKLALLYGWRFQVLSQLVLTDRRGPIFQFPARNVEFVATEIGSAVWLPPHDVQDAALKKFGTTLPLELRQRLMKLGWNEDETVTGKSDWEQVPVSSLPSLQFPNDPETEPVSAPSTPMKTLQRQGSTGSAVSVQGKRRRAIFAPVLLSIIHDQAAMLAHDPDSIVWQMAQSLVGLLERDDPSMFLRPFTDGLSTNFRKCLANLNAVTTCATPTFAYSAMNAIVGYLKTVLRTDATFGSYAPALSTVSVLIPRVSGISLRDIRKHKAEHVLLPASIHEEEGGFKLHSPWRDGSVAVQTAQLLILNEILKVNPREVYLFKKMLSNLPIQASITHKPFARAWLVLVVTLFSTVNRNYNDRAELRHFLTNVGSIIQSYGMKDQFIVSHALRVVMLCSARFRRLFASMGFSTVYRTIFTLYTEARGHTAIRDGIEYACRSFYRIHQDTFVYQACVVLSEDTVDPESAYNILACLSVQDRPLSGVASGLRGLNDKEEIEALVQMISGPELTLSEIGTDAAERQASKMANINLDSKPFPRENMVKLLVTVIAANPATKRGIAFLNLYSILLPYIKDPVSIELVKDSVEALITVISKNRVGDDVARLMFSSTEEENRSDWSNAKKGFIALVEVFVKHNGHLSSSATKKTLEMVNELLRKHPTEIGFASASILMAMGRTQLHASGNRPIAFLEDIAPLVKLYIGVVDLSGLFKEITDFVRRAGYALDAHTSNVIIGSYLEPAVTIMKSTRMGSSSLVATVDLLSVTAFLPGDALDVIGRHPIDHNVLVTLIWPLCLVLDAPREVDREVLDSLWIRILNCVVQTCIAQTKGTRPDKREVAMTLVISVQIIKIILLRGSSSVSKVTGLWSYIAKHLSTMIKSGNGVFSTDQTSPRLVDWMRWSCFRLVSLFPSPLMLDMRHLIQISLIEIGNEMVGSAPSTPGESRFSFAVNQSGTRARVSSARSPSFVPRLSTAISPNSTPMLQASQKQPSSSLTPEMGSPTRPISPLLNTRRPSMRYQRPSFTELSARRASVRPTFKTPSGATVSHRFPSSQPVRQLGGEKSGGIIHLLGSPNRAYENLSYRNEEESVLAEMTVKSEELCEQALTAIKACQVVFGFEHEEEEEVRAWSLTEAIEYVVEETRLLIEVEFADGLLSSQPRDRGEFSGGVEKGYTTPSTSFQLDESEKMGISEDDEELVVEEMERRGLRMKGLRN